MSQVKKILSIIVSESKRLTNIITKPQLYDAQCFILDKKLLHYNNYS